MSAYPQAVIRTRSSWFRVWTIVVLLLALPANVFPCIWDYDTLRQERSRFPSALELITGKFWRHSPEFYQWRIKDRQERLKSEPQNLDFLDDLAVAYQKTGQHERAVEVMLEKEKIKPGEYKTYSNLGTFYILAGDFDTGLPYIDKALAIDPNAHFGREKYQKWLVEYAQSRMEDGKLKFPLRRERTGAVGGPGHITDFTDYLRQCQNVQWELNLKQVQAATQGVLGMMRFADHNNPLLLEALGDLLQHGENQTSANQLAARCYLQASYVVTDKEAAQSFRSYAERALYLQVGPRNSHGIPLKELEREFKAERDEASKWYATLKKKELALIKNGTRVEKEFDRLATEETSVIDTNQPRGTHPADKLPPLADKLNVGVTVVLGCGILLGFGAFYVFLFGLPKSLLRFGKAKIAIR